MAKSNPKRAKPVRLTIEEWALLSAIGKITARGDGWPGDFINPRTYTKLTKLDYIAEGADGKITLTTKGFEDLREHRQELGEHDQAFRQKHGLPANNPKRRKASAPYVVWQHSTNDRWFVSREGYGSAVTSARGYGNPVEAWESARDLMDKRGEEGKTTIEFADEAEIQENPMAATKRYSDREQRLYNAMRERLGWKADDAAKAIEGHRAIQANGWAYGWEDYYDEDDGEKSNRVILVDENEEEIGHDYEYTFSDIGQAATAGLMAYHLARSGKRSNPATTDRATILAARLARGEC